MKDILIIGAGLGGLATALRLRHLGYPVSIFEKQSRPGGRSNIIEEDGFRVDIGPTILVMKEYFDEFYRFIGQDIDKRLSFIQLDPNYRIYFHDGSSMDMFSDKAELAQEVEKISPGSTEHLFRFMGSSARKYELGMEFVDRNYDRLTDIANPIAGIRLLQTRAHQNLYKQVADFFAGNEKLTKAFSFHSMFLGLSPYDALAMFSMITYADFALGMWYPIGGIYSLVEDMLALGREMGVKIYTDAAVEEIYIKDGSVQGLRLKSGERFGADIVISNADLPYTYRELIDTRHPRDYSDSRLDEMQYACSGYVLYLGVRGRYPNLRHQGLFFSEDYKANLDSIFNNLTLPEDPSFHLNTPTVTDPNLAPQDHSLLYVLAPMPNLRADIDWDIAAPIVREKLLNRLEQIVDPDIRNRIVWERDYRPTDWQSDINATLGTAFGSLSQSFFQSSYFRPHNKSRDIKGLYFVGQGTYPGIGMPMVLISSRLVTERIVKECPLSNNSLT